MASTKESKKTRSTFGNLAYDLDSVARELDQNPGREIEFEIQRTAPVPATEPKSEIIPERHNSLQPRIVACIVVICVLVGLLLVGYIQMTKVSSDISATKKEIAQLKDEYISLLGEYEKVFDMDSIKQVAEESGMSQPTSGQIEYIDVSSGDSAVIYTTPKPDIMKTMFASVSGGVLGMVEFFQ